MHTSFVSDNRFLQPGIDQPGDIIVILKQEPHAFFKRDGHDLICSQKLALVDSLCGFSFFIRHLDGHFLHVVHAPGNVIKPGDVKTIEGEGASTRACLTLGLVMRALYLQALLYSLHFCILYMCSYCRHASISR